MRRVVDHIGYPNSRVKRKRTAGVIFDVSAQALFDAIPDLHPDAKIPLNNLIKGYKSDGVWNNANFWKIMCLPTLDMELAWIEIKSLTTNSKFNGYPSLTNSMAGAHPNSIRGWVFTGSNYAITDFIPSAKQTLNDVSEVYVIYQDESVATNAFNYGSLNVAGSSSSLLITYGAGGVVDWSAHAYATNGRVTDSHDGSEGIYLCTRRSSIDGEVYHNGVSIATSNVGGGSLPTVPWFINTYNQNGSPNATKRSQAPTKMLGSYGESLSVGRITTINGLIQSYLDSTKGLKSLRSSQIIVDGNSHTEYQQSAIVRKIAYDQFASGVDVHGYGVASQTTQAMQADFASQIVPLFDGTLTHNIYIPNEITNDYWFGATKEDAFQNYKDLCLAAQTAGFLVVAVPVILRKFNGGGANETNFNLAQDYFNTRLLSEWGDFADAIADPHPNAWIYRSDYASDSEYNTAVANILADSSIFKDVTTHLTEAQYIIWGATISASAQTLLT